MAITLEQHQAWQNDPDARRAILVIVKPYDIVNAAVTPVYVASEAWQTKAGDSITAGFQNRLIGDFEISYKIPFLGESRGDSGIGRLQFNNADGGLDIALYYAWAGRAIEIYWGDPSWGFDDFAVSPLLIGYVDRIENSSDDVIEVYFADVLGELNREVQSDLITSGPNKDKPLPLCYGQCYNISPVCLDENLYIFQIHDGAIQSIDSVYDNGVLLTESTHYTTDLVNGKFTMLTRPIGTITADVKGAKYSGAWVYRCCEIAKALIVDVFGAVESYLDLTAFSAIDTAKPYTQGIYIEERNNLLDVLDTLFSSIGAWYYWDGVNSKLTAGLIKNPELESADYSWNGVNIGRDGLSLELADKPQYRTRLGYAKCWTVQTADQLAASITDPAFGSPSDVAFVGSEYRETVYNYDILQTIFPKAIDPQAINTLIVTESDAFSEVQARQVLLGGQIYNLNVSDISGVLGIMPGDILTVTDDDYGLSAGKNIQVLEVRKQVLDGIVDVRGWFLVSPFDGIFTAAFADAFV